MGRLATILSVSGLTTLALFFTRSEVGFFANFLTPVPRGPVPLR